MLLEMGINRHASGQERVIRHGPGRQRVRPPTVWYPFAAMRVVVNGEDRDVPEGTSIADLLGLLGLAEVRVAVEVNRTVIPRARHPEAALSAGDRVEVVQFVGGG